MAEGGPWLRGSGDEEGPWLKGFGARAVARGAEGAPRLRSCHSQGGTSGLGLWLRGLWGLRG